ncbi:MAG: DNA polymerase II large subunit [Nitrosopumilus sp.]|nr:DNA polymerase II large subunit [Nitrosopumilus sp.]
MPELCHLEGTPMPARYRTYYEGLAEDTFKAHEAASAAKATLADGSAEVEPKIVFDLADRVSKMHDIDITDHLRDLLAVNGKELSALTLAREIALGEHSAPDTPLEERLDLAVRVGLAVVTEGVTIAPLQGISEVCIKENRDGTKYLSVSIAGPMRSAGGTESAVTMLIADHVRRAAGLDRYQADCFDDETGRFVEELRIYERESAFQFHILDEDIERVISNLPVELDGVDTDPFEVVNHKGMARIKTDRVRGGALRVLNDGLIGRSKKLLKRIELYKMEGWGWLADLRGAVQTGDDREDAAAKRMSEVIAGRSVLSIPKRPGGFRLRYGRACNTGFAAAGLHPAAAEILDHTVTVGTQIKTDMPGKGATVAFVDSIETPTVRLKGGDVVRVRDVAHARELRGRIEEILYLGDVLVSVGDFVENNARLVPSGFVEEFWEAEARASCPGDLLPRDPGAAEALAHARRTGVPLHPRHLYFWDVITREDLESLLGAGDGPDGSLEYGGRAKEALEKLGVPHRARGSGALVEGDEALVLRALLAGDMPDGPVHEAVSASGITIRPKWSTSVGVRVGRPEKAAPRSMRPPAHAIFPVGERGGSTKDIIKASRAAGFEATIQDRYCDACGATALAVSCPRCGGTTSVRRTCRDCGPAGGPECAKCGRRTTAHSRRSFPLREELARAQERARARARDPFKGVGELIGQDRAAEPLEKGLARQKYGLTTFKDGTVRFDATNSPLTQFRPAWIGTPVARLRELGYTHDARGEPLEDPSQEAELMMQDVVIPLDTGMYLVEAAKYVDYLLVNLYGRKPFYGATRPEDLVGHLVVGLAPHTSVGIVGRIIGYAKTQVCFGTPNWHSAKRRDADGDADSLMLLADSLLNFSRGFLSDRIGGLMDAPLIVQPLVLPHESQPQAHNLEVAESLPLEFFRSTMDSPKASDVGSVELSRSRLDTEGAFEGYHCTHGTSSIVPARARSAYATLDSMLDKCDMQIRNAEMIRAVDASEIVSNVISTHLVPDIMGNLRSFARQKFRCTRCNTTHRRITLSGDCPKCKIPLKPTITRPSVEKYLHLAETLVDRFDVGRYQRGRIGALADEIDLVFGKSSGSQALLTDY